jgi:hypothetical protein
MRKRDKHSDAETVLMGALPPLGKEGSKNEPCFDRKLLKKFLNGSVSDINIQDRILSHLDSCPACLGSLKRLRQSRKAEGWRAFLAVAVVILAGFMIWLWHTQHTQTQTATLNLESSGILRSVDEPPLILSRSTTRLHLILSTGEAPGLYEIQLLKSVGDPPLTKAQAFTHMGKRNLELDTDFDIGHYPAGAYVLAVRRSHSSWQYRSLRLK